MQTAQEIYTSTIRELPVEERLRLAALILNEVTQTDADNGTLSEAPQYKQISSEQIQSALGRIYVRYSDTLKRLAE